MEESGKKKKARILGTHESRALEEVQKKNKRRTKEERKKNERRTKEERKRGDRMASMASQEGGKGGKGGDANGESGEERKAEKVDSKAKPFRSYYGDWNAKAAELAREVDEEEDAAAEEARNAGGPMSKEEAEDRRKHEALKKAKKLWEGRKAAEKSLVYELTKAKASSLKNDIVVTEDLTGGLPVFEVKGCEDCRIFFPPMLRGSKSPMIKIVISDCKDCSLIVACPLMVGIDIVHCEGCKLEMPAVAEEAIVKTLQVDLSKDVSLTYTKGGSKSEVDFTRSKFKVYHAGVIG